MEKVAKDSQSKMGQRHAICGMHLAYQQNQIKQNHTNRQNPQITKSFGVVEFFGILDMSKAKREDIYGGGGAIKNGKRDDTYAHRESGKPNPKGKYE